jgi:hypothetical protein
MAVEIETEIAARRLLLSKAVVSGNGCSGQIRPDHRTIVVPALFFCHSAVLRTAAEVVI